MLSVALMAGVLLSRTLEIRAGSFVLDNARCESLIAIPPPDPLLEKEHCNVCEMIVKNSNKWNWASNFESLCTGVPPHALPWCMHYVCKLTRCEFFQSSSCPVSRSSKKEDTVNMDPCPAKYICSYCLDVPQSQVFGCFDSSGGC